MRSLLIAVRRAARRLLKAPTFTVTVIATTAVGTGAIVSVFALANGVLLRPLPYPHADRLVSVQHTAPGFGIEKGGQSAGTYLHYRRYGRAFEEIGAYTQNDVTFSGDGAPERVHVAMVTPSLLVALGTRPALGRPFRDGDVEADAARVVLISHDLWVTRFGSDPGIIGRKIELNRWLFEVVGVLPAGFDFPTRETQVWYPMAVSASKATIQDLSLSSIARLKRGVTADDAESDLQRLVGTLSESYPDAVPERLREGEFRAVVVPLKEALVGNVRPALLMLLCAAGLVLLIAWANTANLFLVRAERQRRDVAVERALGATDGDLARRFLTESLLLTTIGGLLGLALACAAVKSRFGFEPGQIPRLYEGRIDAVSVAVAVGLAMLGGLFLGTLSIARMGRAELGAALKGAVGRTTAGREAQRVQRLLVALQVAVALALLIASGVLAQSFWRLSHVRLGFEPRQVVTIDLSLPYEPYPEFHDGARFYEQLMAKVRALPGVADVEAVAGLPLTQPLPSDNQPIAPEDEPLGSGAMHPPARLNLATPGYFRTMRIPLVRGRGFQAGDVLGDTRPVIVSDALAQALFPGADPIGKQIRLAEFKSYRRYTIVGIVGSTPGATMADGAERVMYFPMRYEPPATPGVRPKIPNSPSEMSLVVRTSLPPVSLAAAVRRLVDEADPKVPVARVRTMDQIVAASTARIRLTMLLLLVAAGTALFLGIVGIYGVVSYTVGQRTSEFGVRLALGASAGDVSRMVLWQGVLVVFAGMCAGLVTAFALTRLMRSLLYGVSHADPTTFVGMSVLLLTVAVVATYVPARRAGAVDPLRALRAD